MDSSIVYWIIASIFGLFIAIFLVSRINIEANYELVDLSLGSLVISVGFVYLLPQAEEDIIGKYPYAGLILISVFAMLTLISFIRDALSLMDENILTPMDVSKLQKSLISDASASFLASPSEHQFRILDHIPEILFWIVIILVSSFTGIDIHMQKKALYKDFAYILIRMIEFAVLSRQLLNLKRSSAAFWVLALIPSLFSPLFALMPLSYSTHISRIKNFSGIVSSILLGIYFYIGAKGINTGLTTARYGVLLSSVVLFISFLIPLFVRSFITI